VLVEQVYNFLSLTQVQQEKELRYKLNYYKVDFKTQYQEDNKLLQIN
jgi:hypothetical protein